MKGSNMKMRFEAKVGKHIFRAGDKYNASAWEWMTADYAKALSPVTLVYTNSVDIFDNPSHPEFDKMLWYAYCGESDGPGHNQITPDMLIQVCVRPSGKIS